MYKIKGHRLAKQIQNCNEISLKNLKRNLLETKLNSKNFFKYIPIESLPESQFGCWMIRV